MGLPLVSSSVSILYEAIFSQLSSREKETSEDGLMDVLKDILRKFEEFLLNPHMYILLPISRSWLSISLTRKREERFI